MHLDADGPLALWPIHRSKPQISRAREPGSLGCCQHNLELVEQLYPHHKDRARVIAVVKQGRQQLEEQMAREREERDQRGNRADSALFYVKSRSGAFPLVISCYYFNSNLDAVSTHPREAILR